MSTAVDVFDRECSILVPSSKGAGRQERVIHWYASLAGEDNVSVEPDVDGDGSPARAYRYDWVFGVSCAKEPTEWWDWLSLLNHVSVQLLVRELVPGDSDSRQPHAGRVAFIDESASLLALHPSRDTADWFQRNAGTLIQALAATSKAAEGFLPGAGAGSKAFTMLANAVPSGDEKKREWFLQRFYDAGYGTAIEWHINSTVMEQYGSLVRGCAYLRFQGPEGARCELSLRAGMMFDDSQPLDYSRPDGLIPQASIALTTVGAPSR